MPKEYERAQGAPHDPRIDDVWEQRDRLAEIADFFLDQLQERDVDISIEPFASMVGDLVQTEEHMADA